MNGESSLIIPPVSTPAIIETIPVGKEKLPLDIMDDFNESEKYRRPWTDKCVTWYKLYRFVPQTVDEDWMNNINIAQAYHIVETITPHQFFALYPGPEFFTLLPRERSDRDYVKNQIEILKYQLHDCGRLPVHLVPLLRQKNLFGITAAVLGWNIQRQHPTIDPLNVLNLYWEPGAKNIEDSVYVIIRALRSKQYIQRKFQEGIYNVAGAWDLIDKRKDPSRRVTAYGTPWEAEWATAGKYSTVPPLINRRWEVLERWKDGKVETVVDGDIIVRDAENKLPDGLSPVLVQGGVRIIDEFLGIGGVEPIEPLCWVINDLLNNHLDALLLSLHSMVEVKKGANLDLEQLVVRPDGIVEVSQIGQDFAYRQHPPPNQYTLENINTLRMLVEEIVGVTKYFSGGTPERKETYRGIETLIREANQRFALDIADFQNGFLQTLVERCLLMNEKFLTREAAVRMVGAQGITFKKYPKDIFQTRADVRIIGSPAHGDTSQWIEQLKGFYQMFAQNPALDKKVFLEVMSDAIDLPKGVIKSDTIHDPYDEHMLFLEHVGIDPSSRENFDEHLKIHLAPNITAGWDDESKMLLNEHVKKTVGLRQELERAMLEARTMAHQASAPRPVGTPALPRTG